jgi:hydrogenase maturation protein HypF
MKSLKLSIGGIVQGVGFRPFVYNLAHLHELFGYVLNNTKGVEIVIQGSEQKIELFCDDLLLKLPPLARIETIKKAEHKFENFSDFQILKSDQSDQKSATISPDMAICDDCLREMRDEKNRRFGYFLTNCTNCGPRYSIIKSVPYDRTNTSMSAFVMCKECEKEYNDPPNRRYHAQPIGCHDCGAKLFYIKNGKNYDFEDAIDDLMNGKILAIKGLGGFHLMCDATNDESVKLLRERKRRPTKPFAVLFSSLEEIKKVSHVSQSEEKLINSHEKPIVLVKSKPNALSKFVAPNIDRLGVFVAYTPLQHKIFDHINFPLIATSANFADEPIIHKTATILEKLSLIVDGVLTHNREIVNTCDDSLMQVVDDQPLMLRLARGFAPYTITLKKKIDKKILAVGANQKSSIAIAFDDKIILSPHIGDLGSLEANEYFERTIESFKRFYDFEPELIICDKHPHYESTIWAKKQKCDLIQIQHHYAHLLAVMAEFRLDETVLAFVFDGTGYGDDGTIWGGEVFLADTKSYERLYHLKEFSLLGAERAIKEPRRCALGILFELFSLEEILTLEIPTLKAFNNDEIKLLHVAWQKEINSPKTSSMGRLFDAISSLSNIAQHVTYEGESGLLLESFCELENMRAFEFELENGEMDFSKMVRYIVNNKLSSKEIASRFIVTLAEVIIQISKMYNHKVIFSGGVFQNRTLLEYLIARLKEENIAYFLPSCTSVNDGSVALGQVYYIF